MPLLLLYISGWRHQGEIDATEIQQSLHAVGLDISLRAATRILQRSVTDVSRLQHGLHCFHISTLLTAQRYVWSCFFFTCVVHCVLKLAKVLKAFIYIYERLYFCVLKLTIFPALMVLYCTRIFSCWHCSGKALWCFRFHFHLSPSSLKPCLCLCVRQPV